MQESKASPIFTKKIAVALSGLAVFVVVTVGYIYLGMVSSTAPAGGSALEVAATVDGVPVSEAAVARLVAAGLDRANALDRAVNQAVAAKLAQQAYSGEVQQQLHAVELEIGASVYLRNTIAKAAAEITDEAIQKRFEAEVKAADFNGYQLAFALYPDQPTAEKAIAGMQKADAAALQQLQPLVADQAGKPGYVGRDGIPYGLGVLVAKMKPGEFLNPTVVRNGVLVLKLLAVKEGSRPELAQVKEALRQRMADEQVTKQLAEARKAAKVELK